MELGLGVWMDSGKVRSERMMNNLWTACGYYRDLGRFDKGTNLMYLIVI